MANLSHFPGGSGSKPLQPAANAELLGYRHGDGWVSIRAMRAKPSMDIPVTVTRWL